MNRFASFLTILTPLLAQNGGLSIQSRVAISVNDFGAEGSGAADDTAAIQAAFDASCGSSFSIETTTGIGVSPIVITTAAPHAFTNRSLVTITNVAGNTNANGTWLATVISPNQIALFTRSGDATVGNGVFTSGGSVSATLNNHLYFPSGTYNISSPLVTRCPMFLSGDGPAKSIIFQTHQYSSIHGIIANFSLRMEDIAVNTTPLTVDYGMVAVLAGSSVAAAPMLNDTFEFVRFGSAGFNFGLDINGTSETDLVASIKVQYANISVGTKQNAVSQPINASNAIFLNVENSTLTGNSLPSGPIYNDHAIYTIAVRGVLIRNNLIQNNGNSAIKLLQGGFFSPSCPTIQNYSSWTIDNNRIAGAAMAIAAYTYCNLTMPSITITNNQISNLQDNYLGDYAAILVEASCESSIGQVVSGGNSFKNLGLGGIFLASQIQGDTTCSDPTAQGTISEFNSTNDSFSNWSLTSPGTFPAINSAGPNLIRASVSQMRTEGNSALALNLAGFMFLSVSNNQ